MPAYRFHCTRPGCGYQAHRYMKTEEFDQNQYSGGFGCEKCGTPRMAVLKTKKTADDGFKPGFQRNIRKYCETYAEYKAHLKNMGLIELGYEDLPNDPEDENFKDYWTDDVLKEIYEEAGVNLDGELIRGLQSGEIKL